MGNHADSPHTVDPVIQRLLAPLAMPTTVANFEGEYNEYGPIPPDTNGDVGRNHYVQIVNTGFTVFDKSGNTLYGPTNNNVLFTGFGGVCETTNNGDPVALYNSLADRWLLSWFAFTNSNGPTHQCIAVSTSPDPLGTWYRYDFLSGTGFEDYPHLGVWPDAYYMTTNTFNAGTTAGNYAFNRAKMLVGDPTAEVVIFRNTDGGMLPTNFEGPTAPPAGSPNYFFEWYNNSPGQLAEYKFHVDFTNTALSTFLGPFLIPVANFNLPGAVPEPGTTTQLDTISDRLMYRVEYRNFGTYKSVVLNHTVSGGSVAAPRWYELRDPNNVSGATVYQQGTYAPADGVHRWMGSIAQDGAGDIAMGFSAGSSTLYPSIRYAGRLVTDPLGTFAQGEATLYAGTGSEDYPSAHRWGDYSSISIDPVDDCTFWYTTMYFAQTGMRDWRTRIGSFKFPNCTGQNTPTPVPTSTPGAPTNTPTATPTTCPGGVTYTGAITTSDPTQTGRLGLSDPKSSCGVVKACASSSDTLVRHYRSYTYTNNTGSAECLVINITQDCGNNAIQSVAYLGSFNPSVLCQNYLGDGGASGHSFSYSINLAAGQTAVIVVLEVSPNLGCATYTLSISPCPPAPTATRTSTSTRTATRTPTGTRTATNTPTFTVTQTPVITMTPTSTATNTATATPAAAGVVTGHLTWQGIGQPDNRNNGITATLSLCVGGSPQTYNVTTNANGVFSVTTGLSDGVYNWQIKAVINLANAGTLSMSGGTANVEMGTLKAGDSNNSNNVNATDFNIFKSTFGKGVGQPGYDARGDFNRDGVANSVDFNLLKGNFGQGGASLTCP